MDKSSPDFFTPLGYDHGQFYYLSHAHQQIIQLSAANHNGSNLLQLAPLSFWRDKFKGPNASKPIEWSEAANWLIRDQQAKIGPYDPWRIRGRGAWWNTDKPIVHFGDKILYDGKEVEPNQISGQFIYERAPALKGKLVEPLGVEKADKFLRFMESLSWEKILMARLAAGWCVCAHIGGALRWRPHLWVTGRKGSGKTTVMEEIIHPILGDNCQFFLGGTSEAGIRQSLGRDSLPVMFDEIEGENSDARARIQNILSLVRQSSSETSGRIAKGTPSGDAMVFSIRSCFVFSSINAALMQSSDKSRVTLCELTDQHMLTKEKFDEEVFNLITPEFTQAFYARAISMTGVIRKNAEIFSQVVRNELKDQRAGDQIGTLLAGAYSLESDTPVTVDYAQRWVQAQDWEQTKARLDGMSDEVAMFQFLMQQSVRNGSLEFNIGELVEIVVNEIEDGSIDAKAAHQLIHKYGFSVVRDEGVFYLAISHTHAAIGKMLQNTRWAVEWSNFLKRIDGSKPSKATLRFGGSSTRATLVPWVLKGE